MRWFLVDCTVKIWDLASGNEVSALGKHHSYVRKVTYCEENKLAFTACQSVIKVCLTQPRVTIFVLHYRILCLACRYGI